MRAEFIYDEKKETINEYMTRAAELLRKMQAGMLANEMTETEQMMVRDYIFGVALREVEKEFQYIYLYQKGLQNEIEDFYANFAEVLVNRLHTYNCPESLTKSDKKYQFATFLKDMSGEVIRKTYAGKHGVPMYVEIELQRLRTLRKKIARELEIPEDDVTPKMISEWSQRSISEYEVRAILDITAIHKSMEQIMEEGIATDKAFQGTEDVETNAFDVLDYDVCKVFDGFFSMLSDIEKYFVLVKVGCSDVRLSMTYQQIAVDELFVSIVEADKKFSRNISVGQIVVERPDRKSVKNCQKLVLEDVKHVNYTFIQYMKPKTEKKLQTLKDTLRMSDITGDCGIAYFMDQWERLLRKYK